MLAGRELQHMELAGALRHRLEESINPSGDQSRIPSTRIPSVAWRAFPPAPVDDPDVEVRVPVSQLVEPAT